MIQRIHEALKQPNKSGNGGTGLNPEFEAACFKIIFREMSPRARRGFTESQS